METDGTPAGEESFLCECGGLAQMLGGYGVLGAGQYLEKTFGGAGYPATQQLGVHTALHIELDIVRVDAWNGEMIKVLCRALVLSGSRKPCMTDIYLRFECQITL